MQLILAIVADQQQAAQLAALIDGRLAVDLVQAAEVGEGLLALDERIPDLILTSPLMSPFDDGVLDEYLRDLGPAGAHVQTLRIPVLGQAPKKAPRLGFSLRRRAKPEPTTPVGCDPKVFADEIALYLSRAAEEPRHASTIDAAPVIERHVVQHEAAPQPIGEEQWTPAYSSDDVAENAAWRTDLLDRPPAAEAPANEPYEVETIATWREDTVDAPAPAPVEDLEELATPALVEAMPAAVEAFAEPPVTDEQIAVESVDVYSPAAVEDVQATAVEETQLGPITAATAVAAVETEDDPHKATPSFKAALAAIRAAWGKPSSRENVAAPAQETNENESVMSIADAAAPIEVDLTGDVDLLDEPTVTLAPPATAAVQRPFVPADSPEELDVYELAVEPDMKELESELVTPPPPESSGDRRKKPAKRTTKAAKAKSPRQSQPQAAQDEWGVFDPNRCGFAALVDKLDEVADDKVEQPATRGKARVISCS